MYQHGAHMLGLACFISMMIIVTHGSVAMHPPTLSPNINIIVVDGVNGNDDTCFNQPLISPCRTIEGAAAVPIEPFLNISSMMSSLVHIHVRPGDYHVGNIVWKWNDITIIGVDIPIRIADDHLSL
jgi:hypothetical protein